MLELMGSLSSIDTFNLDCSNIQVLKYLLEFCEGLLRRYVRYGAKVFVYSTSLAALLRLNPVNDKNLFLFYLHSCELFDSPLPGGQTITRLSAFAYLNECSKDEARASLKKMQEFGVIRLEHMAHGFIKVVFLSTDHLSELPMRISLNVHGNEDHA